MGKMKDFFSDSNEEICEKIIQHSTTLSERIRQLEKDLEEAKSEILSLESKIEYLEMGIYEKNNS